MDKSSWKLKREIASLQYIYDELEKSKKKLEKQIEKREAELKQTGEVLMYVPVKYTTGEEKFPICNEADLLELWQTDCIKNERTYDKYYNKLMGLLKTKEKEEVINQNSATIEVIGAYMGEILLDIARRKSQYEQAVEREA